MHLAKCPKSLSPPAIYGRISTFFPFFLMTTDVKGDICAKKRMCFPNVFYLNNGHNFIFPEPDTELLIYKAPSKTRVNVESLDHLIPTKRLRAKEKC